MVKKIFREVELMAPAGSWESLRAAIQGGADSVYFGVDKLNMRARAANNFKVGELKKIMAFLKKNNVKGYLTLNIVVYDTELKEVRKVLTRAKQAEVDAVIASDFSVISEAKNAGMKVHLSTQANVSNIESLKFYSKYVDAVVLARELNLNQIKEINKEIKKQKITGPSKKLIKTEIFVHGALCVAISGKCYMSLATYGTSANRGDCLQTCRRKYRVFDEETNQELVVDNEYVMSPSDLCTISELPLLLGAGVSILKIEGRGRSPEYVFEVTKAYRDAIDLINQKKFNEKRALSFKKKLGKVFNRGFWEGGYYLGSKKNEWANTYGSKAAQRKLLVGRITNYYGKSGAASLIVESHSFKKADELLIIGPTTGVINFVCEDIQKDKKSLLNANKNELVSLSVPCKVRKNDKVYVVRKC